MDDSTLQRLVDESAIRDVLALTFRGADHVDVEMCKTAYWPDATFTHIFGAGSAYDCLEEQLEMLRTQTVGCTHNLAQSVMRIDGDAALCESVASVFMQMRTDGEPASVALAVRILDRLQRRDGEWRISDRTVYPEWQLNMELLIGKEGVAEHFSGPRKGLDADSWEILTLAHGAQRQTA